MRLKEAFSHLRGWSEAVPPERRSDYRKHRSRVNYDRLQVAAWAFLLVFGILLAQHALYPGVSRGSSLYYDYVALYAILISFSAVFLAAARLSRRRPLPTAQYAYVLAIMLTMSMLSVVDSEISSDQSAFFFASLGMAVLFRCDGRHFTAFVLVCAAVYLGGRIVIAGSAPAAAWTIPFVICAVLVVSLAFVLNLYDARAFALNQDLKAANERLAADALKEEQNARELGEALVQRDELLVELQHRVKNNLNLVASILNVKEMQLGEDGAARVLGDMRSRIQALASFYERLNASSEIQSVNFALYASDIIDSFLSTNSVDQERIAVERNLAPLRVRLQKAIALGLIMNELFTNSIKHAFADGREGRISISLESDGIFGRLRVEDDGAGMPGQDGIRDAKSFGLRLVALLGSQIDAELRSLEGPGTRTEIVFPIP